MPAPAPAIQPAAPPKRLWPWILILLLLVVGALAHEQAWWAIAYAVVVGRIAVVVACRRGVAAAPGSNVHTRTVVLSATSGRRATAIATRQPRGASTTSRTRMRTAPSG